MKNRLTGAASFQGIFETKFTALVLCEKCGLKGRALKPWSFQEVVQPRWARECRVKKTTTRERRVVFRFQPGTKPGLLELAEHLAITFVAQALPGGQVDVIRDEANGPIGQQNLHAALV